MSWEKTYTHAIAIGADMFGSALRFSNTGADITISSMCGLELRKQQWNVKGANYVIADDLIWLGNILNKIQTNHCELAIKADLDRLVTAHTELISVPSLEIQHVS